MYVLVRKDLTEIQQAVQAGHALAEYLLNHKTNWTNGTLIYLRVPNEEVLSRWYSKLKHKGIACEVFREPDLDHELTALAAVSCAKVFRSLKLL